MRGAAGDHVCAGACRPFSIEEDLLTPTFKFKRPQLQRKYQKEVRAPTGFSSACRWPRVCHATCCTDCRLLFREPGDLLRASVCRPDGPDGNHEPARHSGHPRSAQSLCVVVPS